MSRVVSVQTNFSSGELDPRLFGRVDLRSYGDGAQVLRNVLVHTTGGISRRPGTRTITKVNEAVRLVPFDDVDGGYIIAIGVSSLSIIEENELITLGSYWTAEQIHDLDWVRHQNSLLLCHPSVRPRRLTRLGPRLWELAVWEFDLEESSHGGFVSREPWFKFAPSDATIRVHRDEAFGGQPAKRDQNVFVTASVPVFTHSHYGTRVRVKGRIVELRGFIDEHRCHGLAIEDIIDDKPTAEWAEAAFSSARGWPRTVAFHQDRLVIGGSRDLPDRVWASKTGFPFNFDLGTGLDDQSIAFRIASDTYHVITAVVPSRVLQVLTTAGEWIVRGQPLTPFNVQLVSQTKIGSQAQPRTRPIEVDGATLFAGATGKDLREFLYTDVEQAYQAADLATMSRHLLDKPVEMAFDGAKRVVLVVRDDGAVAAVTIDRTSNIVAWSLLRFAGPCLSIVTLRGKIFILTTRSGSHFVEVLDDTLNIDQSIVFANEGAIETLNGLDNLVGEEVLIMDRGAAVCTTLVASASIPSPLAADHIVVGLPFTHVVVPMPSALSLGGAGAIDAIRRPTRIVLRTIDTTSTTIDTGDGARVIITSSPVGISMPTDTALRCVGWRRGVTGIDWKIVDRRPLPFSLLAVQTEYKVNM